MAIATGTLVSLLNDLIETCKDGEKGYLEASEEIENAYHRMLLVEFARLRGHCAHQLQSVVRDLHAEPDHRGSVAGAFHRGWIDFRKRVRGSADAIVLKECERGEEAALKNYEHALNSEIPSELRELLLSHERQIQLALNHIRAMRM
jgi:uncharacterized protein (TIGR02284 family)